MSFISRFRPTNVLQFNRAMANMFSPSMAQAFAEMQRLQDQIFGPDPFEQPWGNRRNYPRGKFAGRYNHRLQQQLQQRQQSQPDQAQEQGQNQTQEATSEVSNQNQSVATRNVGQSQQQLTRPSHRSGDLWSNAFGFPSLLGNFSREIEEFTPTLNVVENKDNFALSFSIPGGKKEEIKVTIDGDQEKVLTVSGERRHEFKDERQDDGFSHFEESFGSFSRSVYLPENVNVSEIKARFEDGVLKINLPKVEPKEPEKPKAQEVNID